MLFVVRPWGGTVYEKFIPFCCQPASVGRIPLRWSSDGSQCGLLWVTLLRTLTRVSPCGHMFPVLLGTFLEVELLDPLARMFNFLKKLPSCLPKWCHHCCIFPPASNKIVKLNAEEIGKTLYLSHSCTSGRVCGGSAAQPPCEMKIRPQHCGSRQWISYPPA